MDKRFPKGGRESDVWEKFPNNPVVFFDSVPKVHIVPETSRALWRGPDDKKETYQNRDQNGSEGNTGLSKRRPF